MKTGFSCSMILQHNIVLALNLLMPFFVLLYECSSVELDKDVYYSINTHKCFLLTVYCVDNMQNLKTENCWLVG